MIKLRMKWMGHVARMGEGNGSYRVWFGNLRERDRFEDPDIHERVIIRWILR
jgi:hypothetical protein